MSSRPLEELSDRELNLFIAEKIFGATAKSQPKDWPTITDDDGCVCPALPDFVGDISAAMEVVEKMRADGWGFKLDWTRREEALAIFRFKKNETILKFEHAFNNRVERAIVLAALRAMGVEEVQGPSAQGHDLG